MIGKDDLEEEVGMDNEDILKVEPQFGHSEAQSVCENMSLNLVKCGSYLVVIPTEFDAVVLGEPYLAFMLLIDMKSGIYFTRIWNQTLVKGKAVLLRDFIEACVAFFGQNNKACVGYPIGDESDSSSHEFVISQTPVPRKVSKSCHRVVYEKFGSCPDCLSLRHDKKSQSTKKDNAIKDETPSNDEFITETNKETSVEDSAEVFNDINNDEPFEDDIKINDDSFLDAQNYPDKYVEYKDFETDNQEKKKHCCSICNKSFSDHSSLKRHGLVHQEEGKFPCDICGKVLKKRDSLRDHMRTHNGEKPFHCNYCHYRGSSSSLLAHHKKQRHPDEVREEKRLKEETKSSAVWCSLCSLKFDNMRSLYAHKRKEHPISLTHFISCPMCDLKFESMKSLTEHKRVVHLWALDKFQCPQCPAVEETVDGLVSHMKQGGHPQNQSTRCPTCWETCAIAEMAAHYSDCAKSFKKNYGKRKVCCETCGKSVSLHHFKQHLRVHVSEKEDNDYDSIRPLYCDQCGKRFNDPQYLRLHVKYVHEGKGDDAQCTICNLTFDRTHKLRNHRRIAHPTEEDVQFKCKYCGKQHGSTHALKAHLRKHEAPKFVCSHCDLCLKSEVAWKAHERQHTGEKPFKCSICGAAFTSNSSLRQHNRGVHKIGGARGGKTGWYRIKKKSISEQIDNDIK